MNIVRGRVVRDQRYFVEVTDAQGAIRFPLPDRSAEAAGTRLGQEVYLGLRPETITHRGTQRPSPHLFHFDRKVDVVEPTGPDTLLVFTLGEIEAIARVHPEDKVPLHGIFPFEVDMGKAKIFDAETGKRL